MDSDNSSSSYPGRVPAAAAVIQQVESSTATTESSIAIEVPVPVFAASDSMAREPHNDRVALPSTTSNDHSGGCVIDKAVDKLQYQHQPHNDVASPNDTDVDEDGEDDDGHKDHHDDEFMDSDGDLGTPLGIGAPPGFGEFDDDNGEYASHRFLGPSIVGKATSARALHGLRRVMAHAKPPKFASELSSLRASFSFRRSSSAATADTVNESLRSHSIEHSTHYHRQHQHNEEKTPLNAFEVTFSGSKETGFSTRLSISETTAELAVRVASVDRDSQAFKAGVVVGDTLLTINDNPIEPHMTETQVHALLVAQRGPRTIVFARRCAESNLDPHGHKRSRSQSQSKSRSSFSSSSTSGGGDDNGSIGKKPTTNGRFTKSKFTSALSYGSSLMAAKLKRKKPVVHRGVPCDGCGVDSISGALWTCSVCPDYNLCSDCYEVGTHGMENTAAMQTLNEALVQFRLQKKCKRFTPEFLLSLRRDICKGRPDKFEYMGGWIADIVNGTAAAKITVRGIEIPHLPQTSRQRFVSNLMPLVSNRRDIEVNIEWLPDDSQRVSTIDACSGDMEMETETEGELENLRIWISDKKTRTASPFA